MSAVRFIDTAAQFRDSYGYPPVRLAFEQTARVPFWSQRWNVRLTAPPYRSAISPDRELMHIVLEGDCLVPYFPAGRKCAAFDARLGAQDGDYVLVEASAELKQLLVDSNTQAGNEFWLKKYAAGISDTWCKQLRCIDGIAWMVERSSALPLGKCRVLGVLVNYMRSRKC